MTNTNANPLAVTVKTNAGSEHRGEDKHSDHGYTNISGPEAIIIAAVLSALIIAIGWVVVHRNTRSREREAREHADRRDKEASRTELLSALEHWHHTFVVVTDPAESKRLYYHGGGMKELASSAAKFRRFVTDKDAFDKLNLGMSEMTPQTLDSDGEANRRDTICGAIRKFREFVRNA